MTRDDGHQNRRRIRELREDIERCCAERDAAIARAEAAERERDEARRLVVDAWDDGARFGVGACSVRAAATGEKVFHRPVIGDIDNPYRNRWGGGTDD